MDRLIEELKPLQSGLYGKDFLLTWERTEAELKAILKIAEGLKSLYESNCSTKVFQSGLAVSLFRDHSTRTRFSYASAANLLGLTVQDLDEGKSQIAHGETVRYRQTQQVGRRGIRKPGPCRMIPKQGNRQP